ncbi:MAG TPA: DUF2000 family protein [Solirubrobacteraceae bacterium]|nr:DUF2000 family protein [Solirubrobacteraceae bacterium]
MSQRPDQKIVVAINKRLDPGPAINAAAHAMLGLYHSLGAAGGEDSLKVIDYPTADESGFLASALPLIVLVATPAHLARLRRDLLLAGLPAVGFHQEMTGGHFEDQLARSAAQNSDDLELYAVATAGEATQIDPLTRRCKLYQGG